MGINRKKIKKKRRIIEEIIFIARLRTIFYAVSSTSRVISLMIFFITKPVICHRKAELLSHEFLEIKTMEKIIFQTHTSTAFYATRSTSRITH